jgi:hypothetical protein
VILIEFQIQKYQFPSVILSHPKKPIGSVSTTDLRGNVIISCCSWFILKKHEKIKNEP